MNDILNKEWLELQGLLGGFSTTVQRMILEKVTNEINAYGYGITNIEESMFEDFDKEFKIYTVELKNEIEDYDKLFQIEKTIKEKLNLYSKGIMLEIV